jgi:hypothetical protein
LIPQNKDQDTSSGSRNAILSDLLIQAGKTSVRYETIKINVFRDDVSLKSSF